MTMLDDKRGAPIAAPLTADAFRRRAEARLDLDPPGIPAEGTVPDIGDHALSPELVAEVGLAKARPAAVLIPVLNRPEGATVLLTQRTATLRSHAGQIAFPGGRVDAEDSSPLVTALREAEEEIGLDRRYVDPVGYLDLYLTTSGFHIVPVVAVVEPGFELVLNPAEVDDVFEVPLSFLMTPANHETHAREWQGRERRYYAMPYGDRYIWGVTAGIIKNLYDRVYGS